VPEDPPAPRPAMLKRGVGETGVMPESTKKQGYTVEELRELIRKQAARTRHVRQDAARATGPEPVSRDAAAPKAVVYRRDRPRAAASPGAAVNLPHVRIEDAVAEYEVIRTAHGELFVVTTRVRELAGAETLDDRFRACIESPASGAVRCLQAVTAGKAVSVHDLLFMDVESTGLGCSPLFLVGIMVWDGGLDVRQYLARNYAEEAAVIHTFVEACRERHVLVTFNGKSFDYPFIRVRAASTGVPFDIGPDHLDLLHVCRKAWKTDLPDCKLQTLEQHICGRARTGDIPGADIPDAYHLFARTGNAHEIVEILKHNLLDLVTLADLMIHLPAS
jgi:uncharacterized protein YprB with RNaseH-like and TPR domain